MDEPTAGLDSKMSQEVMELADQLCENGTTVIISTHDVDLAYAWAEEIHVIRFGKLIYSGPSEGFYGDPVLVNSTGVMQPSMFVINKGLAEMKGLPEMPYPRTESQLISKIVSGNKGSLKVIPFGGTFTDDIKDMIENRPEGCMAGLYGMMSRKSSFDARLPFDFVFNGFESSMAECLKGRDAIPLCDEDCIDLIESKIETLKSFESNVEYTIIK